MLTPYIESGNAVEGRLASRVTEPLEGLKRDQMVESYSGFLTVNKEPLRNSFFWFFPAMVRQMKIKLNMITLVQFYYIINDYSIITHEELLLLFFPGYGKKNDNKAA